MAARAICLFPGQGSQRVGMGRDLAESFVVARRTFEEADDALGMPLSRLCFEGPEPVLGLTEHAQPAILAVSVAAHRVLAETSAVVPVGVCGHSLGEWSALVAAGALDFGDAVRGVRERGRLMQEAVPVGEGTMAAVVGLDADAVTALCAAAADGDVLAPANLNGGGQVVVAGHVRAVDRLVELASARRARVQRLPVSAPFHCSLMAPAAVGLERFLAGISLRPPAIRLVSSVTAAGVTQAVDVASLLVRQLTAPVRWEETVRAVMAFAPTVALEVGPGRVLTGLLKRLEPALPCVPVGDRDGITRARELLA